MSADSKVGCKAPVLCGLEAPEEQTAWSYSLLKEEQRGFTAMTDSWSLKQGTTTSGDFMQLFPGGKSWRMPRMVEECCMPTGTGLRTVQPRSPHTHLDGLGPGRGRHLTHTRRELDHPVALHLQSSTMASNLFQLPDELLAALVDSFPCRDAQIRSLATLVYPRAAPCRNLIIHGTEATGKTAITTALLSAMRHDASAELRFAIVKSTECVTARHLYERTVAAVADALSWEGKLGSCETLAALTVELSKMLGHFASSQSQPQPPPKRFVLVFDAIDRQRDSPPLLLPGLARLSEIIPQLTTVFTLTAPAPALLRTSAVAHLYFPPYTKTDYVAILNLPQHLPAAPLPNTTQQETNDLWTRFTAAVHDSLVRSALRTLPSFQQACAALWPRFTAPVAAGTHKAREFSKLLIAARVYFQDETVLEPKLVVANTAASATAAVDSKDTLSTPSMSATITTTTTTTTATLTTRNALITSTTTKDSKPNPSSRRNLNDLSVLLPPTARLLLMAAYLASHNAPRHDMTLFSTWHNGKRRRGGGIAVPGASRRGPKPKHRKIARKLLGPGVFVMERMMAIYLATRPEWAPTSGGGGSGSGGEEGKLNMSVDGDVGMAIATLTSLRLLVRVGGMASGTGDMDRGGRWRVNVGWEVIRGIGRSMGVEVEEWLVE
ncbi:origin recognition complex subunit 5 C-terminus-domain-containing protein [Microdochium bolleyi]|uniref:Origin recognition complex subunit 5 C-terminus-domain-containing protein n=1 Tax=Microdochium bolleyi TaxID=196109 RepID=A0A136IXG5_9PEZI|nr:origin recognition complex subunit 5 C-terminus-domain-containing protein [Microdochium bolleyi]